MIFLDSAWAEVKNVNVANEHLLNNRIWFSPIQNKEYSIESVSEYSIRINRLSGGNVTVLTRANVERMINKFNNANGRVPRQTLDYTVAVEAALVHLHPLLKYDGPDIVEVQLDDMLSTLVIENANEGLKKQLYARNIRRGQVAFRNHMLVIYDGKCCISQTGPVNVLEAAHIEAHSINGLDDPSNAILLRADLHNLFDDNLLGIHPETLQVYIDPSLIGTIYEVYHLKSLQPRNDHSVIDIAKLEKKWVEFNN